MVRRKGQALAVYWQPIDKTDGKEKSVSGAGSDWGFRLTLHALHPHPVPAMTGKASGRSEPLALTMDLHCAVATTLGLLARSALTLTDSRSTASEALEAEEDHVDAAVDLSLLSAGLADSERWPLTEEQQHGARLVEELLDEQAAAVGRLSLPLSLRSTPQPDRTPSPRSSARSPSPALPLPPSHASSAPPITPSLSPIPSSTATVLLDVLNSHVPGHIAMSASMRRLLAPVESAMLAALLIHYGLVDTAVSLARSLTPDTPASFSSTAPVPSADPPALSVAPPVRSARRTKRALTAGQTAQVDALTPLWAAAQRVERWMIQEAQYANQFHFLVSDVHAEAARRTQPVKAAEPVPSHGITVQSLLQAAMDANRASTSQVVQLDSFIRDKLAALSGDSLARFAAMHRIRLDETHRERAIVQLAQVVKAAVTARGKEEVTKDGANNLERLVLRVWNMAAFLCMFRPSPSMPSAIEAVSRFLIAGASQVTSAAVSRVLAARSARCHSRALSYSTLSHALSLLSLHSVKGCLLHHLPTVSFNARLTGCGADDLLFLQRQFMAFLRTLSDLADAELRAFEPPSNGSLAVLEHFTGSARALLSGAPSPSLASFFFTALISLHRRLLHAACRMCNPILPPPSSTLLSGSPMLPPLCCYAISGSNHVEMEIWSCKTCGFVEGKVVCRSCALSCHAGHDVAFVKLSRAFCDCFLYSGARCLGMHWTEPGRRRALIEERARDCLSIAADLVVCAVERPTNDTPEDAELHATVVKALVEARGWELGDDERLYRLLSLVFRLRHRVLSAGLLAQGQPEMVQGLLRMVTAASLRSQRLAVRLLAFVLPKLPPEALVLDTLAHCTRTVKAFFPSPASRQIPPADEGAPQKVDLAPLIISGVLTLIGSTVLLHSALFTQSDEHEADGPPDDEREKDSAAGVEEEVSMPTFRDGHGNAVFQLVLCHSDALPPTAASKADNPFSLPAPSSSSSSSFLSTFIERCAGDVLHYQHLQTMGADRLSASGSPPDPTAPAKQLDGYYKNALARSLDDTGQAVILEGPLKQCQELGERLAGAGMTAYVRPLRESVGRERSLQHAVIVGRYEGLWEPGSGTGKQRLAVSTELVHLLRTLLHPELSTAAWSSLTRQQLIDSLGYLDADHLAPVRGVDFDLCAAFGALSVVSGSTGHELPSLGGAVRVATREVAEEELPSLSYTASVDLPQANVASALCEPFRTGVVVQIDEAGSELRVVFDDDPRRGAERVHWSRVTSTLSPELSDAIIIPALRDVGEDISERVLQALRLLASPPPSTPSLSSSASVTRFVSQLLQARLLRALTVLLTEPVTARMLFSPQHIDVLSHVARAALYPSVISELRVLQQEFSRGLESLVDLRLLPAWATARPFVRQPLEDQRGEPLPLL